jgi:O-antigen/teichoic acid export membrane protein
MAVAEVDTRPANDEAGHDLVSRAAPTASPVRSVAKGAFALLSTQPLTWAASTISIILAPRYLGDVAFGQAMLGATLVALAGPVVSLGLLEYLSRSLASRSKNAPHEATVAWPVMTIAALLATVVLGVGVTFSGLQLGTPIVLLAALATIAMTPTHGLLLTLLRGQERMGRFAFVNTLSGVCGALVPVIVLVAGGGLNGFALSNAIVFGVALFISWRTSGIRLPRVKLTIPALLGLLPAGLPFFGWTLTMQFYGQIDRIMIGLLAPVQVMGWYGAATRIVGIPIFVPTLIVTPLFPALTRCRDDRAVFRHTLNASLRATLLATAPFCAATAAAAPAIPRFLGWPAEFDAATLPMTILAPNLTLIAMDMMLGTALLALGFERKWLMVGLVAAVVNPLLNLIAIPFAQATWGNGGIGAAAVTVVTESVMLSGALVLMPRGLLDRALVYAAFSTCVGGGVFVLVTRALLSYGLPLPAALVPGALCFVVAVLALRVVSVEELGQLRQHAGRAVGAKFGRST